MGELTVLGHTGWSLVMELSYRRNVLCNLLLFRKEKKKNHSLILILMSAPHRVGHFSFCSASDPVYMNSTLLSGIPIVTCRFSGWGIRARWIGQNFTLERL